MKCQVVPFLVKYRILDASPEDKPLFVQNGMVRDVYSVPESAVDGPAEGVLEEEIPGQGPFYQLMGQAAATSRMSRERAARASSSRVRPGLR